MILVHGASFLAVLIALHLMRVPREPTNQQSTIQAIVFPLRAFSTLGWLSVM
jgi:hypothetical protein